MREEGVYMSGMDAKSLVGLGKPLRPGIAFFLVWAPIRKQLT